MLKFDIPLLLVVGDWSSEVKFKGNCKSASNWWSHEIWTSQAQSFMRLKMQSLPLSSSRGQHMDLPSRPMRLPKWSHTAQSMMQGRLRLSSTELEVIRRGMDKTWLVTGRVGMCALVNFGCARIVYWKIEALKPRYDMKISVCWLKIDWSGTYEVISILFCHWPGDLAMHHAQQPSARARFLFRYQAFLQ